jgi:D-alanyl-D-alanine carboxypeptidase
MFSARFLIVFFFILLSFSSCLKQKPLQAETGETGDSADQQTYFTRLLSTSLQNANLPERISSPIIDNIAENPSFILELFEIMQTDSYLRVLVDKEHSLSEDYEPDDLVELTNRSYRVNRSGMLLRKAAEASLEEMAAAAKTEGLTLLASSAFRTFDYQAQLYERNVRQMGQEAADRESARPGHSQHQLGLVIDFGSITDAFAQTPEGIWLDANASYFGWSLSYPEGYEDITGYRWESWHYRYVGVELAEFIDNYFEGIQHYALKFLHEWDKAAEQIN